MLRRPTAPDTGAPTPSSRRGGLPVALPTRRRAPLIGGVTMGIRAPAHGRCFPKSVFTSIFGIYSWFSLRALMPM